MSCNPTSYFPNKVDEMIFFQDNNLEKVEIINHYNELISQGKYSEASDYVSQQEGVYGFFADFFNLIENRIYNTQEYLLNKPPKKQPFIYYDEEEHFSMSGLHVFHDVLIEEDFPLDDIRVLQILTRKRIYHLLSYFSKKMKKQWMIFIYIALI